MKSSLELPLSYIVWERPKGDSLVIVYSALGGPQILGLVANINGEAHCLEIPAELMPRLVARAIIATDLLKSEISNLE